MSRSPMSLIWFNPIIYLILNDTSYTFFKQILERKEEIR
jgi:hypothetical protein